MRRLLPLAVLLLAGPALAQPAADRPLTVAVDCPGYVPGCDLDFFQTEVTFARFVRDQADGDVFVQIIRETTGGGGDRYTLFFDGRRGPLAGRQDTLTTATPPAATDDDQRRALLSRLRLGLVRFAAETGLADRLTIVYDAPAAEAEATEPEADPWNSWVFNIDGNGYFQGQSQASSANLFGSVSARRVTEALKVSLSPRASYNRSAFELTDGSTFVADNASLGVNAAVAVSLTDHWSAGGRVDLSRATFSNYDARLRVAPAIEYNLFPFSEATRRQIRLVYQAGLETVAYQDTTVLLLTEDVLPYHELSVATEIAQPWGSVDVFSGASQYLSMPDQYNLSIGGGINVRLFQGLGLRLDGRYRYVQDQINLRAARADDGQILTNQQELATSFTYFASVGLSYSFGSIFNQVVNPRLGF